MDGDQPGRTVAGDGQGRTMAGDEPGLTIEELAKRADVPVRTVRFYITERLLPGPGGRGRGGGGGAGGRRERAPPGGLGGSVMAGGADGRKAGAARGVRAGACGT